MQVWRPSRRIDVRLHGFCPADVRRLQHLRDLRDFFGVAFKIRPAPSTIPDRDGTTSEIILSCVGIGHVNVAAKTG